MLAFPSTLPDSSHECAYVNLLASASTSMKLVDRFLKCCPTDKKADIIHVLLFKCILPSSIHLYNTITVEPFLQNTRDVDILPVFSLRLCHEDSLRSLTLKGSPLLRLREMGKFTMWVIGHSLLFSLYQERVFSLPHSLSLSTRYDHELELPGSEHPEVPGPVLLGLH